VKEKVEDTRTDKGRSAGLLGVFRISNSAYWSVATLLGTAVVLSAFLISKHFGGGLPGCGPESGCEALEKTPWGTVPGIRWPVSFVGFAYFLALLAGWMVTNRELPAAARSLLRIGGAASLLFIAVMLAYRRFCPYCIGVHAANLAALFTVEREAWRAARRSLSKGEPMPWALMRGIAGTALGAFVAVSLVLGVAEARLRQKELVSAEADRRGSTDKIVSQTRTAALPQAPTPRTPTSGTTGEMGSKAGFTGRYRLGPEASPIRVVMLTDYQCVDCQEVERQIEEILAARNDVSLSVKHFPMCTEATPGVPCNRYAKQTLHSNACWAARAAEAAGILLGNRGFWEMHRWLFGRGGSFTDAELRNGLRQLGFDPEAFLAAMQGPETLRRVQEDCEEGYALGLYFTPMVFVNGVEFKGWQVPGALRRTIEEVAAQNPPALTATADRPVRASRKDIEDWQNQPVRAMPPDTKVWTIGVRSAGEVPPGSGFVDVVLFGDYQEPYTAAMDTSIRAYMKGKPNIKYTFRHYPIDPKCNPALPPNVRREALHPLAGRAAEAAEAAGSLGGSEAYWKMHDWLVKNLETFSDESLRDAARRMGIDPGALFAEMQKPEIAAAIVEDARAAKQLGVAGLPMVFVNNKWVMRTTRDGENVVLRVIEEAGRP
jgi:protein-disulfide isomerase/uncharacterized membrane protein